jgi:hypothetical protein
MDLALTVIVAAALSAEPVRAIGHALPRAIAILLGQLPAGTRIVARFGDAELRLVIGPSPRRKTRSEPKT